MPTVTEHTGTCRGCYLMASPVAMFLMAGCSASESSSGSTKYDQTWSKDYASTTCADWSSTMTQQQRFAAAADILSGARDKVDGGSGVAPDDLISDFQSEIDDACEPGAPTATLTLTDVTLFIYQDDHTHFAP
jgi:hypothetical protein